MTCGKLLWFVLFLLVVVDVSATVPDRRQLDLQEGRVSSGYKQVLDVAYRRLRMWRAIRDRPPPDEVSGDAKEMSAGRHAILAIQHRHRELKSHLTRAWDSIQSREMFAPIRMRVPMPHLILRCMFSFAMLTGFLAEGIEARDWIAFGMGLIVSFHALLRPCEWCALSADKVAVPAARLQGLVSKGLLLITNGKWQK